MKTVTSLFVTAGLVYLGLCVFLYMAQRRLLYFPVPESDMPGAQSMHLDTGDASLKIWTTHRQSDRAILYFGGNAEDVAGNIPVFRELFPDRALYLVNYRGYAGSSGTPTEEALLEDALMTYDHIAGRHQHISVIGRSLGSAVGVYLASLRPVEKLVLVTPFDSLAAVAQTHYPMFPVQWLMKDRYDTALWARDLDTPVLVIMAGQDKIIPRARTESLIESIGDIPVEKMVIPQADHNSLDAYPAYHETLGAFLN